MPTGTKNLFNQSGFACIREMIYRRLGLPLDTNYVTFSLSDPNTVQVTALPHGVDGSRSPYIGSYSYPLQKLDVSQQLPTLLVWSDLYPPTVNALFDYLQKTLGLYLDDGEFFAVGDGSNTPLVRGGTMPNTLNVSNQTFQLEALTTSVRWLAGSRITLQLATPNSITPPGEFGVSGSPPDATVDGSYAFAYALSGGTAPFTFAVTDGVAPFPLDPTNGTMNVLSVPYSALGTYNWIVTVKDSAGHTATIRSTMTVNAAALVMNPPSNSVNVDVGTAASIPLGVSGGVLPYTYQLLTGTFPRTVSFGDNVIQGVFDGSPSAATLQLGYSVQATDAKGSTVSRTIVVNVNDRSNLLALVQGKVANWYAPKLHTALAAGDTVVDQKGNANLIVTGSLPVGASAPAAGFESLDYGQGGSAHALAAVHNFPGSFSVAYWYQPPTTTSSYAAGQHLISKGANANGGWAVLGTNAAQGDVADPMAGFTANVNNAIYSAYYTQHPTSGWTLMYQGYDTLVPSLSAGTAVEQVMPGTDWNGAVKTNPVDVLTLGDSPTPVAGTTKFTGLMGDVVIFNDTLWSDERKWFMNNGLGRHFWDIIPQTTLTVAALSLTGTVGQPLNGAVTASGGVQPYSYAVTSGALPLGLTLDASTGLLSGTPTDNAGSYSPTLTVSSIDGQTAVLTVSITLQSGAKQTPWSTTLLTSNMAVSGDGQTAYGTVVGSSGNYSAGTSGMVLSSVPRAGGKWYMEGRNTAAQPNWPYTSVGLKRGVTMALGGTGLGGAVGEWSAAVTGLNAADRATFTNGVQSNTITPGGSYLNSLYKTAVDLDAGKVWLALPGQTGWAGGGDPVTGTNPTYTWTPDGADYYLACNPSAGTAGDPSSSDAVTFVQPTAWSSEAPAGFNVWSNDPKLTLTGSLPALTVGVPYSGTLTIAGGDGHYSNYQTGGTFTSNGLTAVLGATSITVSGTPTTAGPISFALSISSGDKQTASWNWSTSVAMSTGYQSLATSLAPIAYWPLNETAGPTAVDTIGGHNATYSASGLTFNARGLIDGSNDGAVAGTVATPIASTTTSADYIGQVYSICAVTWPLPLTTGQSSIVVAMGNRNTSPLQGYALGINPDGSLNFNYWNDTLHAWQNVTAPAGSITFNARNVIGLRFVPNGANLSVALFVNGVKVVENLNAAVYTNPPSAQQFFIGALWDTSVAGDFNGRLAGIALYNKVLQDSDFVNLTAAAGYLPDAYGRAVKAAGAVGYWPANETTGLVMKDVSGNFNDATYTNSGSVLVGGGPSLRAGSGRSLSVSAATVGAVLNNPPAALLPTSTMSMEAIVYRNTRAGSVINAILSSFNSSANGTGVFLCTTATGVLEGSLVSLSTPGAAIADTIGRDGEPYHVAMTRDTDNLQRLYVNGALVAMGNTPYTNGNGWGTMLEFLGEQAYPSSYGFVGYGSDFAIYNRALQPSEVQSHYQAAQLTTLPVTWSPSNFTPNASVAFSNANKTVSMPVNISNWVSATAYYRPGKRYFELEIQSTQTGRLVSMVKSSADLQTTNYVGGGAGNQGISWQDNSGSTPGGVYVNGVTVANYGFYSAGDVIGFATDGNGNVWFSKNGVWFGDPVGGTNPAGSGLAKDLMPSISSWYGSNSFQGNFAGKDLRYPPPAGYLAYDDSATLGNGTTLLPKLSAYWDMHEAMGNRNDLVGTSNLAPAGVAQGTVAGPRGAVDTALSSPGTAGNYLTINSASGDILDVPAPSGTDKGGDHAWFGWINLANANNSSMVMRWSLSDWTTESYLMQVYNNAFAAQEGMDAYHTATAASVPSLNAWHFAALWRDKSDGLLRLQLDNGPVVFTSSPSTPTPNASAVKFGANMAGGLSRCGWIKGGFPTQAERTWLYNNGLGRDYAEIVIASKGTPTVALVHFDETGYTATTVTDTTGNVWTAGGSGASISTTSPIQGAASAVFTGAGYFTTPALPTFNFDGRNFTIECSAVFSALPPSNASGSSASVYCFVGNYSNPTGTNAVGWEFQLRNDSGLGLRLALGFGDSMAVYVPWTPSINTRYDLAVSRIGNTVYFFANGTLVGTKSFAYCQVPSQSALVLGALSAQAGWQQFMQGQIDEVRITNGIGLYSNTYTPVFPLRVGGNPIALSIYSKTVMWLEWNKTTNTAVDLHINQIALSSVSGVTDSGSGLGSNLTDAGTFVAGATNSAISTTSPLLQLSGPLACMAWVKLGTSQTATYPKILWQHVGNDYNGYSNYNMVINGPQSSTPNVVDFSAGSMVSGSYNYNGVSSATALAVNTPYMLLGQTDLVKSTIYVNGKLSGTASFTGTAAYVVSGQPFTVGFGGGTSTDSINASMLPIAVFKAALTPDEIAYLYNSGVGVSYATLKSDAGQ